MSALLGSIWIEWEPLAAWWRYQTVKRLLDPAQREEAFRQILGWRRFPSSDAKYFDHLPDEDEVIDRVIECPQRNDPPLFVVVFRFGDGGPNPRRLTEHHFELVDYDGTLIPCDRISCDSDLLDLNGDGALARAGDQNWRFDGDRIVKVFSLVAVTRKQELLLRVAYHPESWTWEIRRSSESPHADIVLGPRTADGRGVETVVARYQWDPAQGAYVGPAGGPEEEFVRASDFGRDRARAWAELEPSARRQGAPAGER
jgi:hypothetical protein